MILLSLLISAVCSTASCNRRMKLELHDETSLLQLPILIGSQDDEDAKMMQSYLLAKARVMAQVQAASILRQDAMRDAALSSAGNDDGFHRAALSLSQVDREQAAEVAMLKNQEPATIKKEPEKSPVMLMAERRNAAKNKVMADQAAAEAAVFQADAEQEQASAKLSAQQQQMATWIAAKDAQDRQETVEFMKEALDAEKDSYSGDTTGAVKSAMPQGPDEFGNPEKSVPNILANVGQKIFGIFNRHMPGLVKNGGAPDLRNLDVNFFTA